MNKFNYENTEIVAQKGGKVVRKVSIKKGRGYKTITKYHRGKKLYTVKKPIHSSHVKLIKTGKFIPGLFKDCKGCKTKKRRGGNDIEMGPEPNPIEPYKVPADPERFKQQELNMVRESLKPIQPNITEDFFAGPTPEQRESIETNKMIDEDLSFKEPFQSEELRIFRRGGKRKFITRRKKGNRKHITRKTRRGNKLYKIRGGDASAKQNSIIQSSVNDIDSDSDSDSDSDDNNNDNLIETSLTEMQQIRNLINQNNERIDELDRLLIEIEQMSENERNQNRDREEELNRLMEEYYRRNTELSNRLMNINLNRS